VLGRYCRQQKLFTLPQAIHKMTQLPAQRFGLAERGLLRRGYFADLVFFDSETIIDTATYADPIQPSQGIEGVWVNGVLSYTADGPTRQRSGRFIPRGRTAWIQ
jgi:N-acyl-D-amino-acid deacylase